MLRRNAGDPGLSKLGRRQADRTADWVQHIGVHAVFSCPLRRARETAWPIASRTGLRVRGGHPPAREDELGWLPTHGRLPDGLDRLGEGPGLRSCLR
ncbi:histidine phosphatase family protein [Streptomyces violaceus]